MANNSVILEVILQGKNIKLVQRSVDATTDSINRNTSAQERNSSGYKKADGIRDSYQRREKGVAGITSNSTKAFSKQAQTIGGTLVPAYAVLAANIFAIGAAFGALQRAAEVEQLTEGLAALGKVSGIALQSLSRDLQKATGDTLSLEEAMRSTNLVISSGFDSSTLERLGSVAKNASIALGRDTADALARLTRGATKLEPELLDELGIMVRLDEAAETYATKLGKTAGELSNYEKRQAFMNAVLEEGERKFGTIGDSVDTNPFTKLAATFNDLSKAVLGAVNIIAGPLVSLVAGNAFTLFGILVTFGSGVLKQMIPALQNLGEGFRNLDAITKKVAASSVKFTASLKGLPPALQRQVAGLTENNATIKLYQKLITESNANLKLNTGYYNDNKDKVNANTTALANNQARMAANTTAINQFQKAIQQLTNVSTAQTEQIAFLYLEEGNYTEALKAGKQAIMEHFAATKAATAGSIGFSKVLAVLRGVLYGVAGAARLAAVGFILFLPYIGLVIVAFGLLKDAFYAVIDAFKSEETKKYEEQVEKTSDVLDELGDTLLNVKRYREGEQSTIKTGMQLVTAEANALSTLTQSYLELSQAFRDAGNTSDNTGIWNDARLDFFDDLIEKSPEAKKRFEDLYGEGTRFNTLFIAKAGNREELIKSLFDALIDGPQKSSIALKSLGESFQAIQKPLQDFYLKAVPKTGLEDLISNFSEIEKAATDSGQASALEFARVFQETAGPYAETVGGGFAKANRIILKGIEKGYIKEEDFGEILEENKLKIIEATKVYNERLQSIQKAAILSKSEQTLAKTRLDIAKQYTATEAQAREEARLTREERTASANVLDAQLQQEQLKLENINLTKDQRTAIDNEIKALQAQINELQDTSLDTAKEAVLVARNKMDFLKQEQTVQKTVLDYGRRALEMNQRAINIEEQRMRLSAEMINNSKGKGFVTTAEDEAKISEALFAKRVEAITNEMSLKKTAIGLEYDLLKAQYDMIIAETELFNKKNGTNIETEALLKAREGLDAQRIQAEQLIAQEATMAMSNVVAEYVKSRQEGEEYLATITEKNGVRAQEAINEALGQRRQLQEQLLANEKTAFEQDLNRQQEERKLQNLKNAGIGEAKLTAQDIAEFEKKAVDQKKLFAAQELALKLQMIDAEYDLLDAKLKLAKAEATISTSKLVAEGVLAKEDQTSILNAIDGSISLASQGRAAAVNAVTAEYNALTTAIDNASQIAGAQANAEATGNPLGPKSGIQKAVAESGSTLTDPEASTGDKLSAGINIFAGFADDLAKIGPEGALIKAVAEGATVVSNAWQDVGDVFSRTGDNMASTSEKIASVTAATAATFGALFSMQKAATDQQIKNIDSEIEAERNRDGKSKESLGKIAALEKKKDQMKRKAFEQDKKMKMAQTVMATATGAIEAYKSLAGIPYVGPFLGAAAAAAVVAMGAKQLAAISASTYSGGGGSIGGASTPQISVGQRKSSIDTAKSESASGELAYMRGEKGIGGPEKFKPAFMGAKYRAEGGPTTGYVVGEQGPELFVPQTPGRIVPNDQIQQSAPINANITISALDATGVEEILVKQRGNIIGMMREAANSYGSSFMEEVDTAVYTPSAAGARKY